MSIIHPTAIVDEDVELGSGVRIAPWVSVGPGVSIGDGTTIGSHCVISGPTDIGPDNQIHPFCAVGSDPQDKKFVADSSSRLVIGAGNIIREYCSINRGTLGGGGVTRIGDCNWIMAYCHIAHDCQIGNETIFANNTTLAGHVVIDNFVTLGGFTGIHQFCHLGEGSFSAISSIIKRDVPPFVIVKGNSAKPRCINRIGLQRRGLSQESINALRKGYRIVYLQGNTLENAIKKMDTEVDNCDLIQKFRDFIT